MSPRVIVVGCGLLGVTAALELTRRGWDVRVLEAQTVPAPDAASTDICKIVGTAVRGPESLARLAARARPIWLEWNERWRAEGQPALYHESGVLALRSLPLEVAPHPEEADPAWGRIDTATLTSRFPGWAGTSSSGFHSTTGGYAESGALVWALAEEARRAGCELLLQTPVRRLIESAEEVTGVVDHAGTRHRADHVVLAAGWWSAEIAPVLEPLLVRGHQPIWHLRPARPGAFRAESFPVFTIEAEAGRFHGFPLHPVHAVVKIGRHDGSGDASGHGQEVVSEDATGVLHAFLGTALPGLADAEIVHSRLSPCCAIADGGPLIARHPDRPGLTLALGGPGQACGFAPLVGVITADEVEGRSGSEPAAFGWR